MTDFIKHEKEGLGLESLSILKNEEKVTCSCNVLYMEDRHQFVVAFIPSLNLTGYGRNETAALEILRTTAESYFEALLCLDEPELETELLKFGWSKDENELAFNIRSISDREKLIHTFNMPNSASIRTKNIELVA